MESVSVKNLTLFLERLGERFTGAVRALGDKLGPILLQFSYRFTPNRLDRLADHLEHLPSDSDLRFAVEVRNRDWYDTDLCDMLREHNVALVLHDLYYMPRREDVTADFVYIRWIGRRGLVGKFDRLQLDRSDEEAWWLPRVQRFLDEGLDVYGYFSNHWAGHSPASAKGFLQRLGQPVEYQGTEPPAYQPRLF